MLITCPNKKDKKNEKIVSWKCYEKMIHGKTRASLDNMVLRLQYKETTTQVFLSYSRPKLQKFVTQNFVARFQEEQYKIFLETFPLESVMFVIDFVENYTSMDFNEIQEMH
jgi:hypothetical protein